MYASVADMRDEGVTPAVASDERLAALLAEACAFIDRVTGWFFEPRTMAVRMDGRGTPSIEPPYPPIRIDSLTISGTPASLQPDDLLIVGAPVAVGFDAPRFTMVQKWAFPENGCAIPFRRTFPKGEGNVVATGLWGYTEPDGSPTGMIPSAIRRAAMLIALRNIALLGTGDTAAKSQWRVLEERTRDQSYRLGALPTIGVVFTGDPEIDLILARYRRPPGLGAA